MLPVRLDIRAAHKPSPWFFISFLANGDSLSLHPNEYLIIFVSVPAHILFVNGVIEKENQGQLSTDVPLKGQTVVYALFVFLCYLYLYCILGNFAIHQSG